MSCVARPPIADGGNLEVMPATATPTAPFGRVLTAMVTPFHPDGALDLAAAAPLATHLVDLGNDGLVVNGTTGESPDHHRRREGRAAARRRSRRSATAPPSSPGSARTTPRTRSSWRTAAEKAGAHGLLVVTPYYNKPPQAGLLRALHARSPTPPTCR